MEPVIANRRNLKKVWRQLDDAYENLEKAFNSFNLMEDVPDFMRHETERLDVSTIVSIKHNIELLLGDKPVRRRK
ncbi:hypothetical protein [Niallia sp. 03190]|uniref:hypothetical protein n=1 Tax=Niallia sp. 03190 TaxID=3458061 RepID=UPI004044C9B3